MAMKGAIFGDISGSRYEFCSGVDWEHCELFADRCYFTDDSVMSLAIKKAILEGKTYTEAMQEVGRKYPDAGYGGHFGWWIGQPDPKPYGSYGNGAAMRVSFVADYYEKLEDVQEEAKKTAEVTHNHPEGIKGAVTTATCIWMAKNGKTKEEILAYALEQYPPEEYKYSGKTVEWLRKNCYYDVSCQGSVPVAIRCFYEADSFESFMRNIFSIQCDRDTIGAIGGGIVEEYYGLEFDSTPILEKYLDEYLLELVNRKYMPCDEKNKYPDKKKEWWKFWRRG